MSAGCTLQLFTVVASASGIRPFLHCRRVRSVRQNGRVRASGADKKAAYDFSAPLWEWDAKASWFF
ncbi:MAG: hypothetical protein Q7J04_01645, partial [Microcella sp.]|nr:hypothetical protein [Microcella sp.]